MVVSFGREKNLFTDATNQASRHNVRGVVRHLYIQEAVYMYNVLFNIYTLLNIRIKEMFSKFLIFYNFFLKKRDYLEQSRR